VGGEVWDAPRDEAEGGGDPRANGDGYGGYDGGERWGGYGPGAPPPQPQQPPPAQGAGGGEQWDGGSSSGTGYGAPGAAAGQQPPPGGWGWQQPPPPPRGGPPPDVTLLTQREVQVLLPIGATGEQYAYFWGGAETAIQRVVCPDTSYQPPHHRHARV